MKRILLMAATLSVLSMPVAAQQTMHGSGDPGSQQAAMPNRTAAQTEFMAAMDKMNKDMMEGMKDSDPGRSWMKQMAAHHQGAIDMSEVVLKHTQDPKVRQEAQKVRDENQKDLQELRQMLPAAR